MAQIRIRGARTHNLKNIDLDVPAHALVVMTGVSGSGKSSLAFDTLYAEGQRRYVESLSTYARQFLQLMDKPDVDSVEGLSPAIAIEQKTGNHNPRSTVGTVTDIHDYVRLLFARAGTPYCPNHPQRALAAQSVAHMVDTALALPPDTRVWVLAPVVRERKGQCVQLLKDLQAQGFVRFRIDGEMVDGDTLPPLEKHEAHSVDVVVDRLKIRPQVRQRLAESFETALRLADGRAILLDADTHTETVLSNRFACPLCGYALATLAPRLFSFNNPAGACPSCEGLGVVEAFDPALIVVHPERSLAQGALAGLDRSAPHYKQWAVWFNQAGISEDTPWRMLKPAVAHAIVHGTPMAGGGDLPSCTGILADMAQRWQQADNATARETLSAYRSKQTCAACGGTRLRPEARHVFVGEGAQRRAIYEIERTPLSETLKYFESLQLTGTHAQIGERIVREIAARLRFLNDVGLAYLTLARAADTLSGGESQRIRLASQIGSGLTGVMYVLDEPSIGLHARDSARLIDTLLALRDLGNTVLVVEHDEDTIRAADHVIDLGPGAGVQGGHVVAQGTPAQIETHERSLTGAYLSGRCRIAVPAQRRAPQGAWLKVLGAQGHTLKSIDLALPLGLFTCVTGVSGSGKSTLINDTLAPALQRHLHGSGPLPQPYEHLEGVAHIDKMVIVDQSPIGRTPRSNPATYTGALAPIRELFAQTPIARERGYQAGRFSFNVKGGRCEACEGEGLIKVEMHFLPDLYVPCDRCAGTRYNRETLEVRYRGKNISEVLAMTVAQARDFFSAVPKLAKILNTLAQVGLDYIQLGQSATTLSGGEAQRVKLALELSKRDTGRTLYVLDEPTTGLHFHDVALLLKVLQALCGAGNTVVVIEHNLDVIKTADWLIDLGPEGGAEGGHLVTQGTPEHVAAHAGSYTGQYLRSVLGG